MMTKLHQLADRIAWGNATTKTKVLLLLVLTVLPLSIVVLGERLDRGEVNNLLVLWAVVGLVLIIPVSRICAYFLVLRPVRELNALCLEMKNGKLDPFSRLPEEPSENDGLQQLRHNMFWMGHVIGCRQKALADAKAELENAHKRIGESLEYAERIQRAFLPPQSELDTLFRDHFLLWEQRDRVGGDSYWLKRTQNGFFISVIDCTGHGVPGAFMTLIVQSLFDRIDVQQHEGDPAAVLERMNAAIRTAFSFNGSPRPNDGMDCTLMFIDSNRTRLFFSGARNPLFIKHAGGGVQVMKGDRKGVGNDRKRNARSFTNQELSLTPGMQLYTLTDGLIDQAGGTKGLPFGKKRFSAFIAEQDGPMFEQKIKLKQTLASYQQRQDRRDDIMVFGFTI